MGEAPRERAAQRADKRMSLWLTPRSWEGWKARFEERGHEFLARTWPRIKGEVEDIAANRPRLEVDLEITTEQCRYFPA
jgi:hypothetical protein